MIKTDFLNPVIDWFLATVSHWQKSPENNPITGFESLAIIAKNFILDLPEVLAPTVITNIFISRNWILINLINFSFHIETSQAIWMVKRFNKTAVHLTVSSLISNIGAYLLSKLLRYHGYKRVAFKRGAFFKIREIIHMKFQNSVIFSFQITIFNYHNDI